MSFWVPDKIWEGLDVYVIGGGPSLRSFPWDLLAERKTIGCNSAYLLGPQICKMCFFGDRKFFDLHKERLAEFPNPVVSNLPFIINKCPPWLHLMRRKAKGLGVDDCLAWNVNSGAAATNLALALGAARVFLLGIDLSSQDGIHNWHSTAKDSRSKTIYDRFAAGFVDVKRELPLAYPGKEIVRVSDIAANFPFPTVSLADHFGVDYGSGSNTVQQAIAS